MYSFNLKSIRPGLLKIPANRKNANKAFCCFVVVIVVVDVSSFVFVYFLRFLCVCVFVLFLFACLFVFCRFSLFFLAYVIVVLQLCMSGINKVNADPP